MLYLNNREVCMAWKVGNPRPELDAWRAKGKKLVADGVWTWEEYKREYRKMYYALPVVKHRSAANSMIGPTLAAAITEMAAAGVAPKPCATCGKAEDTKWLVADQGAGPEDHLWYCKKHRIEKLAELRRDIANAAGHDVRRMLIDLLTRYGVGAVVSMLQYGKTLKSADLLAMRESELKRKAGRPFEVAPPEPVVKPVTTPPPPAKNGLDSLLD